MLLEVNSGTLPENATDVITKCDLLCKSLLQNEMCQVFYNKIWAITNCNDFITNCSRYNKMGWFFFIMWQQLQNPWFCYKMWQLLQIELQQLQIRTFLIP